MRYARIENDTVMEIIDFDPKGRFVKEIEEQFVECQSDTSQRDEYKDGKFNKSVPKKKTEYEKNQEILHEINETNPVLINGLEDLFLWAQVNGFKIPQEIKDVIASRKSKRDKLT